MDPRLAKRYIWQNLSNEKRSVTWLFSGIAGWKLLKGLGHPQHLCHTMAGCGSVRQRMRRIGQFFCPSLKKTKKQPALFFLHARLILHFGSWGKSAWKRFYLVQQWLHVGISNDKQPQLRMILVNLYPNSPTCNIQYGGRLCISWNVVSNMFEMHWHKNRSIISNILWLVVSLVSCLNDPFPHY